ncbi:MAG: RDD family protein [Chlorobi bacterium]|nr:RDD family protein [Chlorobiota bacterium]
MSQEFVQVPIEELRVGFGRRFGALFLDIIIIILISGIVAFTAGSAIEPLVEQKLSAQLEQTELSELDSEQAEVVMGWTKTGTLWGFIGSIVGLLYSLLEIVAAATPGKMMLGIKIANADGTAASTQTLVTRWLIKYGLASILSIIGMVSDNAVPNTLASLVNLVIFIGCFLALGQTRQALHDRIAKTAVYRREHIIQPEPATV